MKIPEHYRHLDVGREMHGWAADLFPICRSLTGPGVRQTLTYMAQLLPGLVQHEVPSGTKAFDWTVPDEWTIRDAYIADESGNRIIDFRASNLHVMGYSEPVDAWIELDRLQEHLHSLPELPDAIPYVTSYYSRRWGFCLSQRQRSQLRAGRYRVVIDSDLKPGSLTYGELILPGSERSEVLVSTYVCHPSMANNELSGPVLTLAVARWLSTLKERRHTYRIVFAPETLGAIVYLSRNLEQMKERTVAGFVVNCVGDERTHSLLASRRGDCLSDRVANHVLRNMVGDYLSYSFLENGSDERQYCAPGVDLPVCSIMRSKHGTYPEYHSSLDDLTFVTPRGLGESFAVLRRCIEIVEANRTWTNTTLCEPQMGKRGLYPTVSDRQTVHKIRTMMNALAYADGSRDLIGIADHIGADAMECAQIMERLAAAGLVVAAAQSGDGYQLRRI